MITTLEFYENLQENIDFLGGNNSIKNTPVKLAESQIQMLKNLFISWSTHVPEEIVKNMIVDVLKKPDIENGKVYEALVYAWMDKHGIQYVPQILVKQEDCLKASAQGYFADGKIKENNLFFDIKEFGITLPHIEALRKKLEAEIPENYYLTIAGGKNISTKDLQVQFLEKVKNIAQCIMSEKNKIHTDYLYHDSQYGLEFRAWDKSRNSIFTTISEFDPFKWAENNEFYFLYHASQFCINSPYIIFCPYDAQLTPIFSIKNTEDTFWTFRALCRRIFMNLTKIGERSIIEFDGKARKHVSVSTAAKKISAIVFFDVSDDFDYQNCRMFVFQNPNADYKIPKYQIDGIFRSKGARIEDFEFDNY